MKLWKRILIPLSLLTCCSQTAVAETKGFFFENGEYSYKIVLPNEDSRTWFEAEELCRLTEGGHLASITNEDDNRFLNEKIQLLTYPHHEPQQLWLGAIDELVYGAFHWANGEKFEDKSTFWAPGEPDLKYNEDFEVCIALNSSTDLADWVDDDCYETKGYICKIKGIPKRLTGQKRFGYEFDYGNRIYKFIFMQHDMLTWPEAEIYCRDVEKGHLTSVGSLKESKKIEKHLRMLRNYFGFSRWWIGASDLYSEGHFSWTDGSPFKYERWIKGEPSGNHRGLKEDCAVVTTDPHWGRWRDEYCLNHLPFICEIKVCNQRAEIAFAMDASRSVRINGFRRSKEFIETVLKGIKISKKDVHIGLIRYSSKADLIFGFEDHYTHNSIETAIGATKYIRGGTWTHMALSLARTRLFALKPEGSSRPNIAKFLVLLTDGMSVNVELTAKESSALKNEGVHVVVVAIGHRVNKNELLSIASRPQDVLRVSSFARLKFIVESVRDRVCGEE